MTDGNARAAKAFSFNTLLMRETVAKRKSRCIKRLPEPHVTRLKL